jgi:hypothetical protein
MASFRHHIENRLPQLSPIDTQSIEDLTGDTLTFAQETQQQVFGSDVSIATLRCLAQRQFENFLRSLCERDIARRFRSPTPNDALDSRSDQLQRHTRSSKRSCCNILALVDHAQQEVFCPDTRVAPEARFLLSKDNNPTRLLRETLEHATKPTTAST